jgi:hypothetical protein
VAHSSVKITIALKRLRSAKAPVMRAIRFLPDAAEDRPIEAADEAAARSEGQRKPPEHPLHADQAEDEGAMHDGGQGVLALHQSAVKESQRWRHQHDQRR